MVSKIHIDVYNFDIYFSMGQTDHEFKKWISRHIEIEDETIFDIEKNMQPGRTILTGGSEIIIRLLVKPDGSGYWHGVLAHEIFHAAEFIFYRIGSKLTHSNDETWAYLIGCITRNIYTDMFKSLNKKPSKK